jgi:hypothetical protein
MNLRTYGFAQSCMYELIESISSGVHEGLRGFPNRHPSIPHTDYWAPHILSLILDSFSTETYDLVLAK